ncbi:MAG TPA: RNA methyltransferase [Steroidobacteraceae bacterium]|nr:RNA methyltransferase [Steroidobacteraceae bacterium]
MKLEDLKKLHQKKYREDFGCFLVEGEHLVLELQKAALRNPQLRGCELYVTREWEHWRGPFTTHVISAVQMARIADTRSPQGIIARVPLLQPAPPGGDERAVYLHEIQDPGNLGTILRTLAWFGKLRCLLSPASVDPYNSKAVRASMGAIFHVPIEQDVALPSLRERFVHIASLDVTGDRVSSPAFRTFGCYLFGNEARGLPQEQLAALGARPFTIAGCGALESLNLASAVNICVYELNR